VKGTVERQRKKEIIVKKVMGKVREEKLGMDLTGVGREDLADDGFVPVS
jgi:hypothetical protein